MQPSDIAVLRLYQEPNRHYHSVFHVLEMLELHQTGETRGVVIPNYVQPYFGEFSDKEFVTGVVAHDCYYGFGLPKGENERRSLMEWARIAGREDNLGAIEPLILCTITHEPDSVEYRNPYQETTLRAMVKQMIDLDLAVGLGGTEIEFDRNGDNIMREMTEGLGITEDQYRVGRVNFFEGLLARPTIYQTEQFRAALEDSTRANMLRIIGQTV